jgi:hypothetical protein
VFADNFAIVGDTFDSTLATGLTIGQKYPYIAVVSLAIPDKYYWAKLLSLKAGLTFTGVQYSNDGALLITHSYYQSSNECIVVFSAGTGSVLSARTYSSDGYRNYYYLVKSMLISSGVSPMAYILSD